jgi:hypothetical protein
MFSLFNSSLNKFILLLIVFSIYETTESRFVWDFGSYCINYCAKMRYESSPISICSCHRISSNHRQSELNKISSINNNEQFKLKGFLIK